VPAKEANARQKREKSPHLRNPKKAEAEEGTILTTKKTHDKAKKQSLNSKERTFPAWAKRIGKVLRMCSQTCCP